MPEGAVSWKSTRAAGATAFTVIFCVGNACDGADRTKVGNCGRPALSTMAGLALASTMSVDTLAVLRLPGASCAAALKEIDPLTSRLFATVSEADASNGGAVTTTCAKRPCGSVSVI